MLRWQVDQAVTHPSTNLARCCLTLAIELGLVGMTEDIQRLENFLCNWQTPLNEVNQASIAWFLQTMVGERGPNVYI